MAHLIRGKQAGVQGDFSAGIGPEHFAVADINRFGVNSQISVLAYDPVQSLLAVGTNESKFGKGQIYVFGRKRVCAVLQLARNASVRVLQFCADKLLCLDSRNDLSVFSLDSQKLLSSYSPAGTVTALCSDPTLDYALLGMQTGSVGDVLAYDLDREALAPLRINSIWREQNPKARVTPVISLAFHPRDIGSLLIGYAEGAVIYSFKQNKPTRFFQYELPRGAPGGYADPVSMNVVRRPKLTQVVWHPTGTFVLTGHEDGSLVFWDHQKDGRIVMARTLTETNVDKPGAAAMYPAGDQFAMNEPLFRIVWCSNVDPDDTGVLIAGGSSTTSPSNGLTFFELGRTPVYQTSSWQVLSQHFESPKRQRILPTPPNAEVVDFCLIPRTSPHYGGAQDPIALLALLSSGELISMSFPSGYPISPTNLLHVSLTYVHPFVNAINLSPIERSKWLGLTENRDRGPPILQGGTQAARPLKRFESRNIVQTAHADGTVRLWDAGHGDEIENEDLIQVDVSRAVGHDIQISKMSLSGASGEFAVGTRSGEVAIFRWGHNRNAGRDTASESEPNRPGGLANITARTDPTLIDGLLPLTLLDLQNSAITALKLSDVGFFAAGSENGNIFVVDLRGPAIIYSGNVQDLVKIEKRSSFRSGSSQTRPGSEWPCIMEFSVMNLEDDNYSSILLHIGTNTGHFATFKLLPEASGRYTVQFAGSVSVGDRVVQIVPLNASSGHPAYATQQAVAGLRSGLKTNGVLIAVTESESRIFKPPTGKGAHKSWDTVLCHSAAVSQHKDKGYALVGLFGDGTARAFSIPALREIASVPVSHILDPRRFGDAIITGSGDIFGWTGPSETALLNIFGIGLALPPSKDALFNPQAVIPPRPTISNLQWVSGTQHITPADMDILIGGPDRPPSKRMIAQMHADEAAAARQAGRPSASSASAAAGAQDEGYWAYMTRQINERTEKLGLVGDNVNKLEEASSSWAEEVGNFVSKQKRNVVMGVVKSKFGF